MKNRKELSKIQDEYDGAFYTVSSMFGLMSKIGGNYSPPEGEVDAETVQNLGVAGTRAVSEMNYAFYELLGRHEELQIAYRKATEAPGVES